MRILFSLILFCFLGYSLNGQKLLSSQISDVGFIQNNQLFSDQNGEVNQQVMYVYSGKKFSFFLNNSGFSIQFFTQSKQQGEYNYNRLDYIFENVSKNLKITEEESQSTSTIRHFRPNGKIQSGLVFNKIVYKELYKGIDLIFEVTGKDDFPIKYTFVLHPQSNIDDITYSVHGFDSYLFESSCIRFATPCGGIVDTLPFTYAVNDGNLTEQNELPCVLTEKKHGQFGFRINTPYDSSSTIYIDPQPASFSSSSFGGAGFEAGTDIVAFDSSYCIVGYTNSLSGIATTGAYQGSLAGNFDVFILKADYLNNLVWATYFGGVSDEIGEGICMGDDSTLYIIGSTSSDGVFGTVGVFKDSLSGVADAFLSKFSPDGNLIWSSYFGGSAWDVGSEIAYEKNEGLFICGTTRSSTDITTGVSFQPSYGGGEDGYIACFDTLSGDLNWATYFGGAGDDKLKGISVKNGFIAVGGTTNSASGIATAGAHQTVMAGVTDGFVARLSTAGILNWSSYYGGALVGGVEDVCFDAAGNEYAAGFTKSITAISTATGYQTTHGGDFDGFFVKLNPSGARLFSTYAGGSSEDMIFGICASNSNIYLAGHTKSSAGIASASANDLSLNGSSDAFWACYRQAGGTRLWSTYVGNNANDLGTATAFDTATLRVFLTGYFEAEILPNDSGCPGCTYQIDTTGGSDFIGIGNGNGSSNAIMAQATESDCSITLNATTNSPVCAFSTLTVNAGSSPSTLYYWSGPNGFASTSGNNSLTATVNMSGTYYVVAVDQNGCMGDASLNVVVNPKPVLLLTGTGSCSGTSVVCPGLFTFWVSGANTYSWLIPNGSASSNFASFTACMGTGIAVTGYNSYGCSSIASCHLNIIPLPFPSSVKINTVDRLAGTTESICQGKALSVTTTLPTYSYGPITYKWTGPNGFVANTANFSIPSVSAANQGNYRLHLYFSNYLDCNPTGYPVPPCFNGDYNFNLQVKSNPVISSSSDSPICEGDTLHLQAGGAVSYVWSGPASFTSNSSSPYLLNATPLNSGVYNVTATGSNACNASASISTIVHPAPDILIETNDPVCVGDTLSFVLSGADSYLWTSPDSVSSTLDSLQWTADTSHSGEYFVTGLNTYGCYGMATKQIIVHLPANIEIFMPDFVCRNDSMTLNATQANSYSWLFPNGSISNSVSPIIFPITPSDTGLYYLTAIDSNGCKVSAFDTVSLFPFATMQVADDQTICLGDTAMLWADGVEHYIWSGPNAFSHLLPDTVLLVSDLQMEGIYLLTGIDSNACVYVDSLLIDIFNSLPITINSNSPICAGDSFFLSASGGNHYSWQSPTGAIIDSSSIFIDSASISDEGLYLIQMIDLNGCFVDSAVTVEITEKPLLSVSTNSPVCDGDTLWFNASGGDAFSWISPSGQTYTQENLIFPSASTSLNGVYSVVSNNQGQCYSDTMFVNGSVLSISLSANSNSPLCVGHRLFLNSSGYDSIHWITPSGFLLIGDSVVVSNVSLADSGLYCAYTVNALCPDTACTLVNVFEVPSQPCILGDSVISNGYCGWYYVYDSSYFFDWSVVNGNIIQGQGTDSIYVCWENSGQAFINVNVINGPCSIFDSLTTYILTSVYDSSQQISIYPNPTNEYLNVFSNNGIESILIMNYLGQEVLSINANNQKEYTINVEGLCSGIYSIKLLSNSKTYNMQFVVTR